MGIRLCDNCGNDIFDTKVTAAPENKTFCEKCSNRWKAYCNFPRDNIKLTIVTSTGKEMLSMDILNLEPLYHFSRYADDGVKFNTFADFDISPIVLTISWDCLHSLKNVGGKGRDYKYVGNFDDDLTIIIERSKYNFSA